MNVIGYVRVSTSGQANDAVVVLNTSRLWRSDIVKVLVHREFKRYGVDVKSIEQQTYELYNLPDAKPIDLYWAISQLVTQRNWQSKNLTNVVKRLHQQLAYHYPSYKKFYSEIDGKTALAFWHKYPSPNHLSGVTSEELAKYLRKVK